MLVDAHLAPHVVAAVGPGRDLPAEVLYRTQLSLPTLRSSLRQRMSSKSASSSGTKAFPDCAAGTAKRLFHAGQNASRWPAHLRGHKLDEKLAELFN